VLDAERLAAGKGEGEEVGEVGGVGEVGV